MMPTCSICGRRTKPYLIIDSAVYGPTCAKKLGLRKRSDPNFFGEKEKKIKHHRCPYTIDMFNN